MIKYVCAWKINCMFDDWILILDIELCLFVFSYHFSISLLSTSNSQINSIFFISDLIKVLVIISIWSVLWFFDLVDSTWHSYLSSTFKAKFLFSQLNITVQSIFLCYVKIFTILFSTFFFLMTLKIMQTNETSFADCTDMKSFEFRFLFDLFKYCRFDKW